MHDKKYIYYIIENTKILSKLASTGAELAQYNSIGPDAHNINVRNFSFMVNVHHIGTYKCPQEQLNMLPTLRATAVSAFIFVS